jgi:tRNA A-37 threonylcarbamoyl transferase component Bud32
MSDSLNLRLQPHKRGDSVKNFQNTPTYDFPAFVKKPTELKRNTSFQTLQTSLDASSNKHIDKFNKQIFNFQSAEASDGDHHPTPFRINLRRGQEGSLPVDHSNLPSLGNTQGGRSYDSANHLQSPTQPPAVQMAQFLVNSHQNKKWEEKLLRRNSRHKKITMLDDIQMPSHLQNKSRLFDDKHVKDMPLSSNIKEMENQRDYLANRVKQTRVPQLPSSKLYDSDYRKEHSPSVMPAPFRDEMNDSARALQQKILEKEGILNSGLLMQQKTQHHLNNSTRNRYLITSTRNADAYLNSPKVLASTNPKLGYGAQDAGGSTTAGLSQWNDQVLFKDQAQSEVPSDSIQVSKRFPSVHKQGAFKSGVSFKTPAFSSTRDKGLSEERFLSEKNARREPRLADKDLSSDEFPRQSQVQQHKQQTISLPRMVRKDSTRQVSENSTTVVRNIRLDWSNKDGVKNIDTSSEFKLEKVLGKGNSSTVHRAYDLRLNKTVAVKILEKSNVKETYLRDMLQKEIDISAQLDHPNLARMYRVLQDSQRVYIVQEYCGSTSLSQYAEHKLISENKARNIFKQIVQGVNYMHEKGFSHRDLKFSNILINDYGVIKLVDFGFACESLSRQKIFCGTPSYMPPELVKRKDYYPLYVDLWCLGVILYKLLTSNYPFGACNDKELDKKIDSMKYTIPATIKPEVKQLIEGMIKYSPGERMHCEAVLRQPWLKNE